MSNQLGLIEMLLVFGIVLAWAVWELVSLYRADSGGEKRAPKNPRDDSQ